jgi:hypothetical protein
MPRTQDHIEACAAQKVLDEISVDELSADYGLVCAELHGTV